MKRLLSILTAAVLCLSLCMPLHASALSFTAPFELKSQAAILYNVDTDMILYEKNPDTVQMPAQLVQLMVAAVCLEQCSDITSETVTADDMLFAEFIRYEYPSDLRYAQIKHGDELTVEDLIYAMLLTSSCEASVMLADYVGGGSISAFVRLMNDKAAQIGLQDTVFTNPTGLYDKAQVTTAYDMIRLADYVYDNSKLNAFATTGSYKPKGSVTDENGNKVTWTHSNIMMDEDGSYYYKNAVGMKTCNLQKYGRNILVEASRDGHTYLVLLMGAPIYDENGEPRYYHIEEATQMLDWAFGHFTYEALLGANEEIDELVVENAKDENYVILKPAKEILMLWPDTQDRGAIQRIITKNEDVSAPIRRGDKLGEIELRLAGSTICKTDLIAANEVERSFVKYNMAIIPDFLTSSWIRLALYASLFLTALYILACFLFSLAQRRAGTAKKKPRR